MESIDMMCFYSVRSQTVVDLKMNDGRGAYTGKSEASLREEYPDLETGTSSSAYAAIEAGIAKERGAREITEEAFLDALEALPPVAWRRYSLTESFQFSERIYGDLTTIYVRIDTRYYMYCGLCSTKHESAVEAITRGLAAGTVQPLSTLEGGVHA